MHKKLKFILYPLSIGLLSFSFDNENDLECKKFHIGKFEIIDNKINHHVIFERDTEFQIETNQNSGAITKCKIKWLDDCTYVLTYLESNEEAAKKFIGKTLTVTITESNDSKYYFDALLEGLESKISHFVTKLN